ncbi:MAG: ABC transporter permease, partial [Alphaproteobacteria bacterium]|nr:ABC transporter permease [Alphaproteobacteria bacterium]
MWRRVWALIIKEFLAVWNDPRSRAVIIVPPLIQLLVFGYAATFDVSQVATAIYNEDGGLASRRLVARFAGSPAFHVLYHLDAERQIAQKIDPGKVSLVIHIGPRFSHDLMTGRPTTIQAIVDGRQSNTALIILGYVSQIVESFDRSWSAQMNEPQPPAQLVIRSWFNPNLQSQWFIIPGIVALLTMVVTIVVTALTVAREREVGTFEQLLVTPFSPLEILIGKSVPPLAIGLIEGSFIILAAVFWFHVPLRGNIGLLYA